MPNDASDRHLREYGWVRDVIVLSGFGVLFWLAWAARAVTIPLLIGLALAYATDPVIRFLQRRLKVPRWLSASLLLALLVVGLAAVVAWVVPTLYSQGRQLLMKLPTYLDRLLAPLGVEWSEIQQMASTAAHQATHGSAKDGTAAPPGIDPGDLKSAGTLVWQWLGMGLGVVGQVLNTTLYSFGALMIVSFTFIYFAWHLDAVTDWT